jgi:hypothetical protein
VRLLRRLRSRAMRLDRDRDDSFRREASLADSQNGRHADPRAFALFRVAPLPTLENPLPLKAKETRSMHQTERLNARYFSVLPIKNKFVRYCFKQT